MSDPVEVKLVDVAPSVIPALAVPSPPPIVVPAPPGFVKDHAASQIPLTADEKNIRPLTTLEEDRKTQGQRHINLIWETTQALIAISITGAVIYASLIGKASETLSNAFVLVVSMYLVRTNHTKIGGSGGTDQR